MQQPDPKIRQHLINAHDLFCQKQFSQSKKLLHQIKTTHLSIELNSLLCQYKEDPQKLQLVLRKIMDILVAVNIKIYKERPQKGKKRTPKISHEFYFWNIMVLSQLLPNPEITQLVGNQALHFADSLRTSTALMILYQMLKTKQSSSRLASCISLIEKQNTLISRVKKLTPQQQQYRFLNQILFCKVLLKLGMIDGSRIMYMMKFNQNLQEPKQGQITQIDGLHISVHQQLLHAEIEYHAKNYQHALKILGELMVKVEGIGKWKDQVKNIIDHNIALILFNFRQTTAAKAMLNKTLTFFSKDKESSNEKAGMIAKCRDNLLTTSLASPSGSYQAGYQALKSHQNCYSYKLNYRKAQLCLNYYHQLLKTPARILTYQQIHDFYQTVYYYPNLPYFQQKGKNRNPNFTNNKFVHRRYVIHQSQNANHKEFMQDKKQPDKIVINSNGNSKEDAKKQKSKQKKTTGNKKKGKKEQEHKQDIVKQQQPPQQIINSDNKTRLNQILTMCQTYLKQALTILERQKSIIVNLKDEQKGLTQQVNEKLYSQFITYKSSILNLLCYLYLTKQQWHQTVHYASLYQSFQKQYQLPLKNTPHQKMFFNILTYKLQAYTQMNKIDKAYELLHQLAGCVDYGDMTAVPCVSGGQRSGAVYCQDMSQFNNFGFNVSVLHSKDNKIPEAYNSIQKLLQQMRQIPTNPKAYLPLSLLQLLIHYNLRTSNQPSALQLIKRRRILNLGAMGHYNPILNITK